MVIWRPSFEKNWNVLKSDLLSFVQNCFWPDIIPNALNVILIVMIPKVECPEKITQFRPISLCSVLDKLVANVIVNRFKLFLPDIVALTQSSFFLR